MILTASLVTALIGCAAEMECVEVIVNLLMYSLFLITPGTASEYFTLQSTQHGRFGDPMLLRVEPPVNIQELSFQGAWYKTKPEFKHVVTFQFLHNKTNSIPNLHLKNIKILKLPDVSLLFQHLDEDAQGEYMLEINVILPQNCSLVKTVTVTVSVPVSIPVISTTPDSELVEDQDNATLTCTVEHGTNVRYQWLRNSVFVEPSERHMISQEGGVLVISPVKKEDMGRYTCKAFNHISSEISKHTDLSVFYGPYNLAVNSDQGLKTEGVFTVNPGELVFFECIADSNPPNICVWISKTKNSSEILMTGPRFKVKPYELPQGKEFLCRAFNNVTMKHDETKFTLVVATLDRGKSKYTQDGSVVSPLTVIVVSSFVIIVFMMFFLLRKSCHPRGIMKTMYRRNLTLSCRPMTEERGLHRSEQLSISSLYFQASCRSLARLDSVRDLHTTIYDVIKHVPETPTLSLLK
ncbi:hypothetical protein DNTS_004279 [Danionella cerebrum]|uniref:Ig-like domain-containing protein n=1 Tax=Danionella cerebrum TaxID=2873325 RepID=A0A553RI31_9TELE|nr:hypothetical protein DNTS_004279 [Danionella translucida]